MLVVPSALEALESRVASHPDKLAFAFVGSDGKETERHTYATFLARAHEISTALAARPNLPVGSRVLLVFPPGLDMVAALFGCAHAGLIAVPVAPITAHDGLASVERIATVARDCKASAILCGHECQVNFSATAKAVLAAQDTYQYVAAIDWIVAEDIAGNGAAPPQRSPHRVFMLQYTSGSTNRPKGVMVSHENILANRSLLVDHEDPVCVTWLPQHHDLGLIGCYTYSVLSGGTCYGMAPGTFIQRPALWLQLMSEYRATATSAPNFAFELCLDPRRVPDRLLDDLDFSSIRYLSMSAEPVRVATYQRFLARFERTGLDALNLVAGYGLAENTLVVTHYGRGALSVDKQALADGRARPIKKSYQIAAATRLMSCGRPVGDTEVRIVDPETRKPQPEHKVGEIWVRGPSKTLGYWRKPKLTKQTFEASFSTGETGFLRTGDLGFLHDQDLFVCGRSKEMIIVRGQNFFPQDIETAVEETVSGVRKGGTAAVSVTGQDGELSVALVVELRRAGEVPDARAIIRAVRARGGVDLGRVIFVPRRTIQKTTSGKIKRIELGQRVQGNRVDMLAEHGNNGGGADRPIGGADQSLLDELRCRYDLTGDEDLTLLDAGVDSLDLVTVFHALREQISENGWGDLADGIDIGTIQRLSIRDIFGLLSSVDISVRPDAAEIGKIVQALRNARLDQEHALMRADLGLAQSLPKLPAAPATATDSGGIFVTGVTGFLGPYLLQQLLGQTDKPIVALVRADQPDAGKARLIEHVRACGLEHCVDGIEARVHVVAGDLCNPRFGLNTAQWAELAGGIDTIYHNGAAVNYLHSYRQMRDANVMGTLAALQLAHTTRPKVFNHISTTFVFGWRKMDVVQEDDTNSGMEGLDFGYSQTKWVSEGLVRAAAQRGLPVRIFRPSLLTPSLVGKAGGFDITLRLIAFILKHGIGVDAENEISLVPAEIAAQNICAISGVDQTLGGTFHVTREDHTRMKDIMASLSRLTGRTFRLFPVRDFVPEVIARCTRDDPLYPLVDFLIQSVDWMVEMELKRYDSSAYRAARNAAPAAKIDPPLDDVVGGIVRFIERQGLV